MSRFIATAWPSLRHIPIELVAGYHPHTVVLPAGGVGQTVGQIAKIKGGPVVVGLLTFPETLRKLFNGENYGKLVLEVAKE